MSISDEQLNSFIELWENTFHEDISRDEAIIKANDLLNMIRLVYKPITATELDRVKNRLTNL